MWDDSRIDPGELLLDHPQVALDVLSVTIRRGYIEPNQGVQPQAAGGQIVSGPMEVPGGSWILQGMDPQGAMFALVAPAKS